jgi:hypothetical protein
MQNENSLSQTHDVAERLELLRAANEGKLDGLTCPRCAKPCVSAWFSHPNEREYRTWFICDHCGFEMRAQNTGRPPHYSKERDRTASDAAKGRRLLANDRRG